MNDDRKTKKQLLEELATLRQLIPEGGINGREDRYRSNLFDLSKDAILITYTDGKIADANQALLDLFGYTKDELLKLPVVDLYADPSDRALLLKEIAENGFVKDYEVAVRSKNGTIIDAQVSNAELQLEEGGYVHHVIIRDVTEQKRAEEALRKSEERSDALYRVSNLLAGAHDTDEVLDLIVNEAARLVSAAGAIIRLLDGDVLVPSAATESVAAYLADNSVINPVLPVPVGGSFLGHILATKKPLVSEDLQEDGFISPAAQLIQKKHGIHGGVGVPLLANDRSIGVLTVLDTRIRRFSDDEVSLLSAFADQAALALEKARLLSEAETERERAESERERAESLYKVSNLLAAAHDTDEVLDLIVNEAARLVGVDAGFIRLRSGEHLTAKVATKAAEDFLSELPTNLVIEEGKTPVGHVMATKKSLVMEDADKSELAAPGRAAKHGFHGFMFVPLLANDLALGVLTVMDTRVRLFNDDEISLVTAFADQASLALEKARLLNEAETERQRADSLYRVSNMLAGAHDTDEVLDLIVNEATRLLHTDGAYIRLLEGEVLVIRANTDSVADFIAETNPVLPFEEGSSSAGRVMATREPRVVEDAVEDELVSPGQRLNLIKHGIHGRAGVPLLANGRSIGVLFVTDKRIRRFTEDEVFLLAAFADQAALAFEKARLLNEAETRERQATQLYEVTTQLASNRDLDTVLDLITAKAVDLFGCEASGIYEYNLVRDELSIVRTDNFPPALEGSVTLKPGQGVAGTAFQERRPVWTKDRESDGSIVPPGEETDSAVRNVGIRAVAGVPIIIRGQAYGTLTILYFEPHDFSEGEIQLLQTLADSAAVAIGNARFIEEIQHRTAELDATNQELEAFSYSVSHDLRAPLRGIDGFSQALMNEYSDVLDEQAQHYIQRVRTGSERMGQLIDDLLALSQVTRGEMRRENVDLSDLARTIVTGLQERDPQRQAEFVIQDDVVLNGDTRLLRVALENLLGNAWKYTGKREEARIEFGLTEDDGKRTCFVRDDGSGFDMAYADRLFGAFQRLHDASEFEGSGIGLATVQRIINRHGGQIWAESAPDQGATFYFTLH